MSITGFLVKPKEITISQYRNVMPVKATADAIITRGMDVSCIAPLTKSTVPRMRGTSSTPLTLVYSKVCMYKTLPTPSVITRMLHPPFVLFL